MTQFMEQISDKKIFKKVYTKNFLNKSNTSSDKSNTGLNKSNTGLRQK